MTVAPLVSYVNHPASVGAIAVRQDSACHVTIERFLLLRWGARRSHVCTAALLLLVPVYLPAQSAAARRDDDPALLALVARAMAASPRVRAATARTTAARARIGPAGARPDPMLMAGLQNFPLLAPGFTDGMTMKMIGVSQTVLFPGKLRVRRDVAVREADAVIAQDRTVRAELVSAIKATWYDLAYLDAALALTRQQRATLDEVAAVALARYDAGVGSQADVLTARVDAMKLRDDEAGVLSERSATVAALNALLDRASDTPVLPVTVSARIRRAAERENTDSSSSPLLPLDELQMRAMQSGPMLISHQREIDAQQERVTLARIEARPDVDVVLQYGQRNNLPDMVTLQLAIPLRLQQRTKQGAVIAAAHADVLASEAEHDAQRNDVYASIARLHATAERARAQIALYSRSVLPARRAAVDAALASYRGNAGSLTQVLSAEAAERGDRVTLARTLSDFAKSVSALELIVGSEVLP